MSNNSDLPDLSDLDDKLAAFTDRLLERPLDSETGEQEPSELGEMLRVVRQLQATIQPGAPDDQVYRAQLRRTLLREWEIVHAHPKRRPLRWFKPQGVRLAVLAAAMAIILIVGALVVPGSRPDHDAAQGTVGGSPEWIFVLVAAGLIGVGIFAAWFTQRRK